MDVRIQMLEAAETLLDASPDRDISTRAVCDAVGVGAPTLYRLFGDKNGLLAAVVNYGFDRYLAGKRAAPLSADPVEGRAGWDSHVAFALAHPAVYRMMYSPGFSEVPEAAGEALRLLRNVLVRCAAAGRLRADLDLATQTIMSANIGVALTMITQPLVYADTALSRTVRDSVHAGLLSDIDPAIQGRDPVVAAATRLSAALESQSDQLFALSEAETALLRQWLTMLGQPARGATPSPDRS